MNQATKGRHMHLSLEKHLVFIGVSSGHSIPHDQFSAKAGVKTFRRTCLVYDSWPWLWKGAIPSMVVANSVVLHKYLADHSWSAIGAAVCTHWHSGTAYYLDTAIEVERFLQVDGDISKIGQLCCNQADHSKWGALIVSVLLGEENLLTMGPLTLPVTKGADQMRWLINTQITSSSWPCIASYLTWPFHATSTPPGSNSDSAQSIFF